MTNCHQLYNFFLRLHFLNKLRVTIYPRYSFLSLYDRGLSCQNCLTAEEDENLDLRSIPRGSEMEIYLDNNPPILLHDGQPMHFNSYIDLSICSQRNATDFTWSVNKSLYSSDHYPQVIEFMLPQHIAGISSQQTGPPSKIHWTYHKY